MQRYAVTIMIATKDRPADLDRTLRALQAQSPPASELLIIDDGSERSLEPLVRKLVPDARFVRHESAAGQSQRRSEAFALAQGQYILQLDDDSYPVDPGSIERAVRYLDEHPRIGALAFQIFNGPALPDEVVRGRARFVTSFVGCGVLFRKAALDAVGGYQPFFSSEFEEEELSLRLLKADWALYFFPDVLIHHHVSAANRRTARTWARGFRNKLWSMAMHLPMERFILEGAWSSALACWDALRMGRPWRLMQGFSEMILGLPRAIKLRAPMSRRTMWRYDALRLGAVTTFDEWEHPPPVRMTAVARHLRSWLDRPRQRSFWDRRRGDIGHTETVRFAHEQDPQ